MNDSISILVAVFFILIVLRWTFGGSQRNQQQTQQPQRRTVGRRLNRVPAHMIESVRAMFPDIPEAAIQADLQRTGSVEATVDNVLRNGTLPLPPSARPSPSLSRTSTPTNNNNVSGSSSATGRNSPSHTNLVQRYKIDVQNQENALEPPKVWESSPDKRQEMLKKRKEFMVLQARKKLMEQQMKKKQEAEQGGSVTSTADVMKSSIEQQAEGNKDFESMSVEELNSLTPEQRRDHMLQALQKRTNSSS